MSRRSARGKRAAPLFLMGMAIMAGGLWLDHMRETGEGWAESLQILPADVLALTGSALGGLMVLVAGWRRLRYGSSHKDSLDAIESPVYEAPRSQDKPMAEWQKRLAEKSRNGTVGFNAPIPGGTDAVMGRRGGVAGRRRFGFGRMIAVTAVLAAFAVAVGVVYVGLPEDTVPNFLARIAATASGMADLGATEA